MNPDGCALGRAIARALPEVRPRVLLVDDDATMRQLVALVLEGMHVDLILCASVDEARAALNAAPVRLIITDLMMPCVSGQVLLEELAAQPAWRAGARRVVFSAGLDAQARDRLQGLGVEQFLSKPAGVQAIEDCVREALGSALAAGGHAPAGPGSTDLSAAAAAAVQRHFAGQVELFRAYRQSCLTQFDADLQAGEQALLVRDAVALCRLGHNLKSVLRMLGDEAAAQSAQALEAAAGAADWSAVAGPWAEVHAACRQVQRDCRPSR